MRIYHGTTIDVVVGNIYTFQAAAIVNAANPGLRGGGGVDGMVHRQAGPGLLAELIERYPGGGVTGGAYITGSHGINTASYIIHAVGLDCCRVANFATAAADLRRAYACSLRVVAAAGARTIAFPPITSCIFTYPASRSS